MKILIADDEKAFCVLLTERFIQKGNHVECAYDGISALELIKANRYDIIFLDHNMPELTGMELVKYIKENNITARTVMITGYQEINEGFMKILGVDEYLTKPVKLTDIDAIIEKYSK